MKNLLLPLLLLVGISTVAQNKFTFVFLNTKADKVELPKADVDRIMAGHMANIEKMAKEGKLIAAGPFDGGGGIFIFNSNSVDEVKTWIMADPGVQTNRWNIEVLPFTARVGSVCAVKAPYEMVQYNFIRYTPNLSKFTISDAPLTFKQHDEYLKKIAQGGNVIEEGVFGDREGGILIVKGALQKEVIEFDPAVQAGLLELDFKNLYIAKGAFCEK